MNATDVNGANTSLPSRKEPTTSNSSFCSTAKRESVSKMRFFSTTFERESRAMCASVAGSFTSSPSSGFILNACDDSRADDIDGEAKKRMRRSCWVMSC